MTRGPKLPRCKMTKLGLPPMVEMVMMLMIMVLMMAIVAIVVTALRDRCGLMLLMRHGLLTLMKDDDGQWK